MCLMVLHRIIRPSQKVHNLTVVLNKVFLIKRLAYKTAVYLTDKGTRQVSFNAQNSLPASTFVDR